MFPTMKQNQQAPLFKISILSDNKLVLLLLDQMSGSKLILLHLGQLLDCIFPDIIQRIIHIQSYSLFQMVVGTSLLGFIDTLW